MTLRNLREALRLYVIPDRKIGAPLSFKEQAELAVQGGATAIQLRDKETDGRELFAVAKVLADICRRSDVLFIVNDRLDIAMACGADGIHLGQSDLPVLEARRLVPKSFIVGASARTAEEARSAEKDGADYLGVGAVFGTKSKDDARVIELQGLRQLVGVTRLPLVAIGGITIENLPEVMRCGVDGVSVISAAVVGDVRARTANLAKALDSFKQCADK